MATIPLFKGFMVIYIDFYSQLVPRMNISKHIIRFDVNFSLK